MPSDDQKRVRDFLSSEPAGFTASAIINDNPWLCEQIGVDFEDISRLALKSAARPPKAKLKLIGSAAVGFSLNPENPGRPFQVLKGGINPSDLDLALVDEDLFVESWNEVVAHEVVMGPSFLNDNKRARIYWGRLDQWMVPRRSKPRTQMRRVLDSIRRSTQLYGYPATIRVYRREIDLINYLTHHIRILKREVSS